MIAQELTMWRPFRLNAETSERIAGLAPLLVEWDAEASTQRRFPLAGIDAMHEAGLFKLALPKEFGGDECHPVLEMELYEAVARISVSAAWNLLVGNIHTAWAAAYLSDRAVAEMFPSGHRTVVAGQAAPSSKAVRADDGFRVTGRHSWGSGITHANWVMGGFMTDEREHRVFVVPKESVTVLDNWHVIGIEGSGSFDYAVEDLYVPADFTYSFAQVERKRGSARFTLPWVAQASVPHSAVALGGAQQAFEAIGRLAASKRRGGSPAPVADRGAFQRDMGEAYFRINAARDCAARRFEHMAERAADGPPLTATEAWELVTVAASACRAATDIASMAFRYAGGDSVRLSSPIQRALRDVLVAQQHLAATDSSFDLLGQGIINQLAP